MYFCLILFSLSGREIDVQNINTTENSEVISPPQDSMWNSKSSEKEMLSR